jgi:hypothetical protein
VVWSRVRSVYNTEMRKKQRPAERSAEATAQIFPTIANARQGTYTCIHTCCCCCAGHAHSAAYTWEELSSRTLCLSPIVRHPSCRTECQTFHLRPGMVTSGNTTRQVLAAQHHALLALVSTSCPVVYTDAGGALQTPRAREPMCASRCVHRRPYTYSTPAQHGRGGGSARPDNLLATQPASLRPLLVVV